MDTLRLHEKLICSELRQAFSELVSRLIPAMQAKDVELYQHSLRVQSLAIVDAFEVMTSGRNYQKRRTAQQACEELYEHAGTQFDAELVELFCNSFNLHLLDTIHVP